MDTDSRQQWREKRVRTPTILQMEAVECGAASLAMILGCYGRFVPLEELRVESGVSRDGSKASNVLKAARKYGLDAKGFRKEPGQLRELPLPMILFWNFNHFLVLEGIKKGRVYLNDPASGPRVISEEELDQAFTGVVLTFKPGPDFRKGGEKRSILSSLRARLVGCKTALTYVVLAGLFLVIPGLAVPIFSRIFVDKILIARMDDWFKPLALGMALTAVLQACLTWLQSHYLLRLQTRLALTTSAAFFRHIFRLPVIFFFQRFSGEIGSRLQLNDKVAQLLSGQLATNMLNLLMILFYGILMFQYDAVLTILAVFIALINMAALKHVSRKRVDLSRQLQQETGKLTGVAMSGLQMIETLKATGSESDFFTQWAGYHAKVMNAEQQLSVQTQLLSVVPPTLFSVSNVAVLAVGGLRIMEGHLSMGMLVAFQSLMASFMTPVNQMVNLGSLLQESQADMNRLDDVLHHHQDKRFTDTGDSDEGAEAMAAVKLSGWLELKNVTFGYNRLEPPLIEDFSLTLHPGMRVALVGGSGSGKSTVAKLVSGLYEPWEGEMLFEGKLVAEIPRSLFTNSVAMVDQDIFLFEGTVREDITMWDSTIPESDMMQAARDACIHDEVASRAGGYLSRVEEGGANFSGGQRQRLEIARALANNPTILILDEATSALDSNTEKIVDDNIRRRGCTCLIVAHRLSTIRDCDEIIVLDHGRVVQRGSHEEMCDAEGPYAELIRAH